MPNSRLKPAAGEILDSLGAITSSDQISRCWTRLPPSAASISSRNGMATAAISSRPIFSNSRGSAGPSILILCALASSPRMVVVRLALMLPENAISTSVAPLMMNQVLTSWLLTTSPRLSASSKRFWVGSSVFSVLSVSSAITGPDLRALPSAVRRDVAENALQIVDKGAHHGADHQHQQQQAEQDRQRQADEEHLHLRHQPRQDA